MTERFEFTREQLIERFTDHYTVAEDYVAKIEPEFSIKLNINVRHLYLSVISGYKDIERFKNFHLSNPHLQKSDAIKRSAYLVKWLTKFKPIQIVGDDELNLQNLNIDRATIVNELFALHVASIHLSNEAGIAFVINENKSYEIAYDMLFRNVNEDYYIALFQILIDIIRNNEIYICI